MPLRVVYCDFNAVKRPLCASGFGGSTGGGLVLFEGRVPPLGGTIMLTLGLPVLLLIEKVRFGVTPVSPDKSVKPLGPIWQSGPLSVY